MEDTATGTGAWVGEGHRERSVGHRVAVAQDPPDLEELVGLLRSAWLSGGHFHAVGVQGRGGDVIPVVDLRSGPETVPAAAPVTSVAFGEVEGRLVGIVVDGAARLRQRGEESTCLLKEKACTEQVRADFGIYQVGGSCIVILEAALIPRG